MRAINGAVDWAQLAREIGVDPLEGGSDEVARRAIAFLLGEVTLRDAVDYYIAGGPGAEHARAVLWLLQPEAQVARSRCLEIYHTAQERCRRVSAVNLLRVVATAADLPLVVEFLVDGDPGVQLSGVGMLGQLVFARCVDAENAEPYLRMAERHPNLQVRDKAAGIREILAGGLLHSSLGG
jgi:hypothetical protein